MCTITLHRGGKGLRLTMNRDEAISRALELAPFESQSEEVTWLGPRDTERAGTWIGVNEYGLTACLLNGNVPIEEALKALNREGPSRGEIIPRLMAASSLETGMEIFRDTIQPERYPPFMLLLATPEEAVLYKAWSKPRVEEKTLGTGWVMVTSSQWNTEEVLKRRWSLFESWCASGYATYGNIPTFNLSQVPDDEGCSPLMQRPHAMTRSVTHVHVSHDPIPITMLYGGIRDLQLNLEEFRLSRPLLHSGSQ